MITKVALMTVKCRELCSVALFACVAAGDIGISFTFAKEPNLTVAGLLEQKQADTGSFQGEAVLRVEPTTVHRGATFRVECEFRCTSGSAKIYNPFLWKQYKLPAQVVISSVDGNVRHELLPIEDKSSNLTQPTEWMLLRGNQSVGRDIVIRVRSKADSGADGGATDQIVNLPPGQYFVQATYNYWLVAESQVRRRQSDANLTDGDGNGIQPIPTWTESQMDRPMAVSAAIKFIVD